MLTLNDAIEVTPADTLPDPPEPQPGDIILIRRPKHPLPLKARVLDVRGWGTRLWVEYWTAVYTPGCNQQHAVPWRAWIRCTDVVGKA